MTPEQRRDLNAAPRRCTRCQSVYPKWHFRIETGAKQSYLAICRACRAEPKEAPPVIDHTPPLATSTVRPEGMTVSVHGRGDGGWLGVGMFAERVERDVSRVFSPHGVGLMGGRPSRAKRRA